jgi:RNA polymerase sigma-70 factor (ECF subfamily)
MPDAGELLEDDASPFGAAVHPSAVRPVALRFEDVYRENAAFVWRALRRLGVREADVEDAMQDVFVVVHAKLGSFEGRARITTWLYGICLRVAHARRRRAHVRHEVGEDEAGGVERVEAPSQEKAAEESERLALLDEALDVLPLEQRAVFTLFELDGLSSQEIAELVDIPIGTVYSRLRLAREAFRRAVTRIQSRGWARTRRTS